MSTPRFTRRTGGLLRAVCSLAESAAEEIADSPDPGQREEARTVIEGVDWLRRFIEAREARQDGEANPTRGTEGVPGWKG